MNVVPLIEIFSSIQGEGLHVGEQMTFVRLQGCPLKCAWCDTPESFDVHNHYRVETVPFSDDWEKYANPADRSDLSKWAFHYPDATISLTGGEPLIHTDFLAGWLPTLEKRKKVLLETGGFLPKSLEKVLPWIDVVSMDIKLPSSAKTGQFWKAHQAFLERAQAAPECYVKIVVTPKTLDKELDQALRLIADANPALPVVLQPVHPTEREFEWENYSLLADWFHLAKIHLREVRVIPQTHKFLGVS